RTVGRAEQRWLLATSLPGRILSSGPRYGAPSRAFPGATPVTDVLSPPCNRCPVPRQGPPSPPPSPASGRGGSDPLAPRSGRGGSGPLAPRSGRGGSGPLAPRSGEGDQIPSPREAGRGLGRGAARNLALGALSVIHGQVRPATADAPDGRDHG